MHFKSRKSGILVMLISLSAWLTTPSNARAQTYPIDCAILLCLSGGWPPSAPCTRAKAEFIRRITPWPVEPPLQIWRCPLGATFPIKPPLPSLESTFKVTPVSHHGKLHFPPNLFISRQKGIGMNVRHHVDPPIGSLTTANSLIHYIQNRANVDISTPNFNFVRSIRVIDVRYAWQQETGDAERCNRSAFVLLGTYGAQGEFSWRLSSPSALPEAHDGLKEWGQDCPRIYHRSVFVDWRDFSGSYGSHQVNY